MVLILSSDVNHSLYISTMYMNQIRFIGRKFQYVFESLYQRRQTMSPGHTAAQGGGNVFFQVREKSDGGNRLIRPSPRLLHRATCKVIPQAHLVVGSGVGRMCFGRGCWYCVAIRAKGSGGALGKSTPGQRGPWTLDSTGACPLLP